MFIYPQHAPAGGPLGARVFRLILYWTILNGVPVPAAASAWPLRTKSQLQKVGSVDVVQMNRSTLRLANLSCAWSLNGEVLMKVAATPPHACE
jgi:hypothetical protein